MSGPPDVGLPSLLVSDAWQDNEAKMYELRGRFIEAMCLVEDGVDGAIASRWCAPEDQWDFITTFVARTPVFRKKDLLIQSLRALGWDAERIKSFIANLLELVDWRNHMAHGRYYACGLWYDENGDLLPPEQVPFTILLNKPGEPHQLDRQDLHDLIARAEVLVSGLRDIVDEWLPKRPVSRGSA